MKLFEKKLMLFLGSIVKIIYYSFIGEPWEVKEAPASLFLNFQLPVYILLLYR